MEHIATLAGAGWLRTRASGSSTASYHLDIWRSVVGADAGAMLAEGQIRAEPFMLVEARNAGRAVLVLKSGEPIAVEIGDISNDEAAFSVLGKLPPY